LPNRASARIVSTRTGARRATRGPSHDEPSHDEPSHDEPSHGELARHVAGSHQRRVRTVQKVTKRLLSWASDVEESTLEQARRTSQLPFVYPHLALMPDAHLGKGATVGSVIPTLRAIVPAAVGVDIGCGMIAVRTQFSAEQLRGVASGKAGESSATGASGKAGESSATGASGKAGESSATGASGSTGRTPSAGTGRSLTGLREAIEAAVPLSVGVYNRELTATAAQRVTELEDRAAAQRVDPDRYAANWRLQLGTLGSGNHFIEVTLDEADRVWLFLHSGSRGVGNKIAQAHIAVARGLMERYWISLPDPDLAYLAEGTDEFWAYIRDLRWAQHFALLNREEMMDRVIDCLADFLGEAVVESERINCHHNFTQQELHFGREVWVSRKGAIEAAAGMPGLIPGSMGTASYVVVGRGNPVSLNSSPHGAGRRFSRSAARRTFSADDLRTAMQGIEYRDTDAFVDEIPAAYKDIDQVMADAADLVEIRHTLRQVVNVKGD
jgi:tRNA-splicing ligase RtcB